MIARAPLVRSSAQHVAHQEVAALECALILVDDAADVQSLLKEMLFLLAQLLPQLLKLDQRRLAAQLLR